MYRYIRSETKELTPAECEQLLQFNTFPGQRQRNIRRARLYADSMIDGSMLPAAVDIASMPDGSSILMNGQHVLTACVLAGKNYLFRVTYYECETSDDAWRLFSKFDTHPSRTGRQIMKGARGLFKDARLHDVPLAVLTHCGVALMTLGGGTNEPVFITNGVVDKSIQPRLVDENPDDVLYVAEFSDKRHLMRTGVVIAIMAIHRKGNGKADEFWRKVADGVGFTSKTDPAYRLREQLLEGVIQADTTNSGRHRIYYSLCVTWWNAWISGDKRTMVKLGAMERVPKILAKAA